MPNALTLDDMSPRLRKVVGRESPQVTSAEEPDGGNLLVRIWRGAGVGNLPAYSTTAFWRHPPAAPLQHSPPAAKLCPRRYPARRGGDLNKQLRLGCGRASRVLRGDDLGTAGFGR